MLLHTTTYNGFGEECATAIEAINILIEENFQDKVKFVESSLKISLKILKVSSQKKIKGFKGEVLYLELNLIHLLI